MRCVSCGGNLIPGKAFCPTCGVHVALTCRGCGATLDTSFRFCADCGRKVDDEREPRPGSLTSVLARRGEGATRIVANASAVEGERKQVTVLFLSLIHI